MRLFRVIYSSVLLTILASLAFAAYVFMTPVTQANFDMRVSTMCVASNLAATANNQFGLTNLATPSFNCSCATSRLMAQNGAEGAVRLAEAARELFINAMRSKLTGRAVDRSRFDARDIGKLQSFFSGLENACSNRL